MEKTFNFYTFASNYQSVVLKAKELKKYFCIEGALYKMNKANYKKLCQRYPWRDCNGAVIDGLYRTEQSFIHRMGIADRFDTSDTHTECLNWIIENSTLIIESVEVLNY